MIEHATYAVHALNRLHAELGERIRENAREARKLRTDMKHVEAVMKLLNPDLNLATIAPRRRYRVNPPWRRRHMFGEIAKVMREAAAPMTAQEIATVLASNYKMVLEKTKMNALASNVTQALKHRGDSVKGDGKRPQRWVIRMP